MIAQPGQDVVAVLPHGLGDDHGSFPGNALEDLHAHALRPDKAVLLDGIIRVGALEAHPLPGEGGNDALLHRFLSRPADLIGRQTQVAAGDQIGDAGPGHGGGGRIGETIFGRHFSSD